MGMYKQGTKNFKRDSLLSLSHALRHRMVHFINNFYYYFIP